MVHFAAFIRFAVQLSKSLDFFVLLLHVWLGKGTMKEESTASGRKKGVFVTSEGKLLVQYHKSIRH